MLKGYGGEILTHFVKGSVTKDKRAKKTIAKRAIVKLELEDLPVHKLLEEMLSKMFNPKIGILVNDLKIDWVPRTKHILTSTELDALVDRMDGNRDGSIDVLEIRTFLTKFLKRSKEVLVTPPVFELLLARLA